MHYFASFFPGFVSAYPSFSYNVCPSVSSCACLSICSFTCLSVCLLVRVHVWPLINFVPVCEYICPSVCLSDFKCICLCIGLLVCVFVYLRACLSVLLRVGLSVCLSICLNVDCLFICVSVLSARLSACLAVRLSANLSVSFCLCVHLSKYLFVTYVYVNVSAIVCECFSYVHLCLDWGIREVEQYKKQLANVEAGVQDAIINPAGCAMWGQSQVIGRGYVWRRLFNHGQITDWLTDFT